MSSFHIKVLRRCCDTYYAPNPGTKLDFYSLAQSPEFAPCPRALNRDSIILSLEPRKKGQIAQTSNDKYMAVFRYGSVVFFNVKVEQRLHLLQVWLTWVSRGLAAAK